MKNSTEFAGDLTLCLYCAGSVLYYRVRHTQDKRLTVDTDTTFSNVSLTSRLSMSASSHVEQLHRVGHFP